MPPHPTFYIKKNLYLQTGGYDLNYHISADYDWMLRILQKEKIKIVYLKKIIIHMMVGGKSNSSFRNILLKMKEDYQIIKLHKLSGIKTLIFKNLLKISQFF